MNVHAIPINTPFNAVGTKLTLIILTVFIVVSVLYSLFYLFRKRSAMPLALTLGSAFIFIHEVAAGTLGCIYFPVTDSNTVLHLFGREVGVFVIIAWLALGSGFILIFHEIFERNVPVKFIWLTLLLMSIVEIAFEEIMLSNGIYVYYGNQPMIMISQFPWWWIPGNVGGCFLAACIAHRYREVLISWKAILIVIFVPISFTTAFALVSLPAWTAVNSDFPMVFNQACGILTLALGVIATAAEIDIFLGKKPFEAFWG